MKISVFGWGYVGTNPVALKKTFLMASLILEKKGEIDKALRVLT